MFSDLSISVEEGKVFHVNKGNIFGIVTSNSAILIARSEYYRAFLTGNFSESSEQMLNHKVISAPVFAAFLKYLYTDQPDLTFDTAVDLLILAKGLSIFCNFF